MMAASRILSSESSNAWRSVPWALVVPAHSTSWAGAGWCFARRVPHHLPFQGLGSWLSGASASMAAVRPRRGSAALAA